MVKGLFGPDRVGQQLRPEVRRSAGDNDYDADGLLMISIKSCNSFSAGQLLIMREVEGVRGAGCVLDEERLIWVRAAPHLIAERALTSNSSAASRREDPPSTLAITRPRISEE